MEIKNEPISENSSSQGSLPSEENITYNINNISEAEKPDFSPESPEKQPFSPKTEANVFDLDQILTKFVEKYEEARKSSKNEENQGNLELKEDFSTLFPQRSLDKELENPDFKLFCKYKGKSTTYGECYKDFCSLVSSIESKTEKRILSSLANKEAGVGSLSSEEGIVSDYFTKEQVMRMNSQQIKENYNKIRLSQQKW